MNKGAASNKKKPRHRAGAFVSMVEAIYFSVENQSSTSLWTWSLA